ncbi:MAG: Gldg family protein [Deltaproteobacteria bacterium]|nr:Gldg family protein [Deltaproteobacteria bacterium]
MRLFYFCHAALPGFAENPVLNRDFTATIYGRATEKPLERGLLPDPAQSDLYRHPGGDQPDCLPLSGKGGSHGKPEVLPLRTIPQNRPRRQPGCPHRRLFQEAQQNKKRAQDLLDLYTQANPRIRYQFIDPDRQPALAQQYGIRNYGSLVLESAGRTQNANTADEEGVTNALLRLKQQKAKKVVFSTGHGERSSQEAQREGLSLARGLLEKENYQVEEVNLLAGAGLPADTAVLVIAGPRKPFFPQEVADLKKYLAGGGHILLLLEPFQDAGLKDWLTALGITPEADILIDRVSRAFGGDFLIPLAGEYGKHPITQKFNVQTFFPTARSLTLTASPLPGMTFDVLVKSSKASWGETNRTRMEKGEAAFDSGQDKPGPLVLAALATIGSAEPGHPPLAAKSEENKPKPGRLALFGDSDFASNGYFNLAGNGDLFLNTVNFLTEETQLIAIRPAKSPIKPLSLTATQGQVLFWVPMILLPLALIMAGVIVWQKRKKAR